MTTESKKSEKAATSAIPSEIAKLSFEDAQSELEKVVRSLEDQHTGLDDALALWERGEFLHAHCQSRLDYVAERIAQLKIDPDEARRAQAEHDGAFADTVEADDESVAADDAPASGSADASAGTEPGGGTPPMF